MKEKSLIITREELEDYNKQLTTVGNIDNGERNKKEKFVNSKGEILTREITTNTLEQKDNAEKGNKQEPPKLSNNKIKFSISKHKEISDDTTQENLIEDNVLEDNSELNDSDVLIQKQTKQDPFEKTKLSYNIVVQILLELMIVFICLPIGMMFGWKHVFVTLLITINVLATQTRRLI